MAFPSLPPQLHYAGPRPNLDMSQDFSLWKHQLRLAISQLCSLDFPRGVSQADATDAGFRAVMQELYSGSHFTEFLACEAWRQAGLDNAAGEALRTLQQSLNAYDEPATDAAIVADPAWWGILGHASLVVKLLG